MTTSGALSNRHSGEFSRKSRVREINFAEPPFPQIRPNSFSPPSSTSDKSPVLTTLPCENSANPIETAPGSKANIFSSLF
jgi:hypothetical protein